MLIGQVLALTGRMALVAAGPVSAGMPVIAEYLSDTPAYASLNRLIRVLPLPGQSLAVIHLTPSEGESGITATVLRLDGTVVAEWRAADWLRQAARQMPEDVRLRTNPAQVGQIYSVTLLPQSGQLAVSIGWRDSSGKSQNGIALLRATDGTYVADKVFILPMSVRDLAPGPGNTIVACVFNARAFRSTHRSPTLNVLDTDGNLVAEAFFQQPVGLEDAAARNNSDARVIALPGDRLAFVSPGLAKAFFVRLEPSSDAPEGGALQPSRMGSLRTTVESVVNLAPPAAGLLPKMGMPWMRAIYVDERQRIGALYSTGTTKRPTVVLMLNTATGASETAVPVPADLRAAYWAEGQLHAITIDGEHAVVTAVSPPADFP